MEKIQNLLKINTEKEVERIVEFIRGEVERAGFKKVIVGLSGGVDSGTVLTLCVRALGRENVLVAILPHGDLNKKGLEDSYKLLKGLKVPKENVFEVDIEPIVDSFKNKKLNLKSKKYTSKPKNKNFDGDVGLIRLGNVMARVRMIILFDLAKRFGALVCGTENKSEYLLGYYTRFGDEASDIEPIRHLYKTQVLELARFFRVPEEILEKPATAGLWTGQTDEKELGFSYEEADWILYLHFEKKYSWGKISNLKSQISKPNVKCQILSDEKFRKAVEKVRERVGGNLFKKEVPRYLTF